MKISFFFLRLTKGIETYPTQYDADDTRGDTNPNSKILKANYANNAKHCNIYNSINKGFQSKLTKRAITIEEIFTLFGNTKYWKNK